MRILVLQDYLRSGGTEHQTIALSRFFRSQGHDVLLMTFRPGGRLAPLANTEQLNHQALQPFDTGVDVFAPGLVARARRGRPDVVLCMGRVANGYAHWLQRRLPDAAVVGTVRTGKRLPRLNRWALQGLRCVVVNTKWWRDHLIDLGFSPQVLHVIPNGVVTRPSLRASAPARSRVELRAELGASEDCVVFVNVAGFRRDKRQPFLIDVCARLGEGLDWQLWLVGDGRAWSRCRRLAGRSRFAARIKLVGYQADPNRYYAAADVAVSASLEDSLPNFLIEAQAMGLPVIASNYRGVREALLPGDTGVLVAPDDPSGFVAAIGDLAASSSRRSIMGEAARRFSTQQFAFEDRAAEFLACISVAPRSGRSGRSARSGQP